MFNYNIALQLIIVILIIVTESFSVIHLQQKLKTQATQTSKEKKEKKKKKKKARHQQAKMYGNNIRKTGYVSKDQALSAELGLDDEYSPSTTSTTITNTTSISSINTGFTGSSMNRALSGSSFGDINNINRSGHRKLDGLDVVAAADELASVSVDAITESQNERARLQEELADIQARLTAAQSTEQLSRRVLLVRFCLFVLLIIF
jgi:hypothetical protein